MQKLTIQLPEIKLVGIKTRTNNKNEFNPSAAKIGATIQKYSKEFLSEKIPNRKNPGTTLCVYTDYESDYTGWYTYFIGEEVTSFSKLPEDLETHIISPQTYAKFMIGPGPMPVVVMEAWQKIWQMQDSEFGGKRRYHADFEIYDQRAQDQQNTVLDICIGINTELSK